MNKVTKYLVLQNTLEALGSRIEEAKSSSSIAEVQQHLEFIERRYNALWGILGDLTKLQLD